ncbi:MAG: hydantoinase/oxoprolinase family protein [Planctomycetaceae bacterium]
MWLGLDIGGANLKASDGQRRSVSRPFPIWTNRDALTDELRTLLANWPDDSGLAVTMTAELADCFATKAEGVDFILRSVEAVAGGRAVRVWQTGGEFVSVREALELVPLVAAANWHALATWAGRIAPRGNALLIDLGSTTLDIIPIIEAWPEPQGATDLERLLSGELVYVGLRRTPLCGLRQEVALRGGRCGVANELFATTLDACLLTGVTPEDRLDTATADGRPATRQAAHVRLAHLLGCDGTELDMAETTAVAAEFIETLAERVVTAIERVAACRRGVWQVVLLSGEGSEWLRSLLPRCGFDDPPEVLSLGDMLGPGHAQAACAYALARLAGERS